MRSKSLPLLVAVFLAAATPSIVFDASRAQVGTADVATETDSGAGTADIAEEVDPGSVSYTHLTLPTKRIV